MFHEYSENEQRINARKNSLKSKIAAMISLKQKNQKMINAEMLKL